MSLSTRAVLSDVPSQSGSIPPTENKSDIHLPRANTANAYLMQYLILRKISEVTDVSQMNKAQKEKADKLIQLMKTIEAATTLDDWYGVMGMLYNHIVKEIPEVSGTLGWALSFVQERDLFLKTIIATFSYCARELARNHDVQKKFKNDLSENEKIVTQIKTLMKTPLEIEEKREDRDEKIHNLESKSITLLSNLIQLGSIDAVIELTTFTWTKVSNKTLILLPEYSSIARTNPFLPIYLTPGFEEIFFQIVKKDDENNKRFTQKNHREFELQTDTTRKPRIPNIKGLSDIAPPTAGSNSDTSSGSNEDKKKSQENANSATNNPPPANTSNTGTTLPDATAVLPATNGTTLSQIPSTATTDTKPAQESKQPAPEKSPDAQPTNSSVADAKPAASPKPLPTSNTPTAKPAAAIPTTQQPTPATPGGKKPPQITIDSPKITNTSQITKGLNLTDAIVSRAQTKAPSPVNTSQSQNMDWLPSFNEDDNAPVITTNTQPANPKAASPVNFASTIFSFNSNEPGNPAPQAPSNPVATTKNLNASTGKYTGPSFHREPTQPAPAKSGHNLKNRKRGGLGGSK